MSESISQEIKWNALTAIVKRLPAQLTYYTSALGAIVLASGGQLPSGLEFVAGGIGANLLSNLIDEVARGKELSDDVLCSQVEEAVQKSDIANLLTKQDFLQGYARLIQRLDTQREISKEILTQLQSEFSTVARADQVEELKSLVLQIQSERVASVVGNMGNSKKRLDVFISSTKRDLVPYRDAVAKVVLSLGMYPIDMATFNPTSRNALQLCYDKVQEAEIFVGIYANRYGYAPGSDITYTTYDGRLMTGDGETSITHWEYLWARERNLPLVLFVVGDSDADNKPLAWPVEDTEDDPGKSRLAAFKSLIGKNHVWGEFSTPDNLAMQVATALHELLMQPEKRFNLDTYLDALEQKVRRHYTEYFVDLLALEQDQETAQIVYGLVERHSKCVITGDGGSGKTQTLYYLLLEAINRKRNNSAAPLPFFVKLSQWDTNRDTIQNFITDQWQDNSLDTLGDPFEWLASGKVLLYADGINEIAASELKQLRPLFNWLDDDVQRGVLTCRTEDYANYSFGVDLPTVRIQPLSEPQIQQIADLQLGDGIGFIDQLKQAEISDLAQNPFLLDTLLEIARDGEALPPNQGKLFEDILEKRVKGEYRKNNLTWPTIDPYLADWKSHYAKMVYNYGRGNTVKTPLEEAENYLSKDDIRIGISLGIIEYTSTYISFMHQRWAEYFAAIYLADHPEIISEFKEPHFRGYGYGYEERSSGERSSSPYEMSDQVVLLSVGILNVQPATKLIEELSLHDPWLSALCLKILGDVPYKAGHKIAQQLVKKLVEKGYNAFLDTVKAFVRLGTNYVDFLRSEARGRSNSEVVRLAAIDALGQLADERAVEDLVQILHYDDELDLRKKCHVIKALADIGDPKAISPLMQASHSIEWDYHNHDSEAYFIEIAQSFGKLKAVEAIPLVIQMRHAGLGPGADVAMIRAIGMIGVNNEVTRDFLINQFKGWRHENAAAESLAELRVYEAVDLILEEARKPSYDKTGVIRALQQLAPDKLHQLIEDYAVHENDEYREYAVKSVGWLGSKDYLELVVALVTDESPRVRQVALEVLTTIDELLAVQNAVIAMEDDDPNVRNTAIRTLDKFDWIVRHMPDEEKQIRYHVLASTGASLRKLVEQFGDRAVPHLVKLLRDPFEAHFAAHVLKEMHWKPISPEDKSWFYLADRRYENCVELGESAIPALHTYLRQQHTFSIEIIKILKGISAENVFVEYFRETLYGSSSWNNWYSVFESGEIADEIPLLIPVMLYALFDDNEYAMKLAKRFIERYTNLLDENENGAVSEYFDGDKTALIAFVNYCTRTRGTDSSAIWIISKSEEFLARNLIANIIDDHLTPEQKIAGVRILEKIQLPSVEEFLQDRVLSSEDDDIRIAALQALGKRSSAETIALLINTFADNDPSIANEAQSSLIQIGDDAVTPLLSVLDKNTRTTVAAINTLGSICQHVPDTWRGKRKLQHPHFDPMDYSPEMKAADAEKERQQRLWEQEKQELGKKVAHQIVPFLRSPIEDVQLAAIQAIKLIQESETLKLLVSLLKDANPTVRARVATALGELEYSESISEIQLLLSDTSSVSIAEGIAQSLKFLLLGLPVILELPVVRVCDYAFQALLNFEQQILIQTIHQVLLEGDNLLKAHAMESFKRIYDDSTFESANNHTSYRKPLNTRLHKLLNTSKHDWQIFLKQITDTGITNQLKELLTDSSPMADENMASDWANSFYDFCVVSAENTIPDEELQGLRDTISQLQFFWSLPVGYYAVQALSVIGTPKSIQLILSAITSPIIHIRAAAIKELSSWLRVFPDSGWSTSRSTVAITEETELLREQVIDQLIALLKDDTTVEQDDGRIIYICELAAEALYHSRVDHAVKAVEAWQKDRN